MMKLCDRRFRPRSAENVFAELQQIAEQGFKTVILFDDNFTAIITTIELSESERVCQASAVIAIDRVTIPAHNFNAKSAVFTNTDTIPSVYPAFVLSI